MENIIALYESGMSIPQVSEKTGIAKSTIRLRLLTAGVLRSRNDAIKLAAAQGRLGVGLRGKRRVFTESHKTNISRGRTAWGDRFAKGVSVKPTGYHEYTRGPHKGRSVHVVAMEKMIGRRLKSGECVHHIDGNPGNNDLDNLALMTRSAHTSLHQKQNAAAGKIRKRKKDGRLC